MRLNEFRDLKNNEVAIVLDNGTDRVAVSVHNQLGGTCDCCDNQSVGNAEVLFIRDAVTGDIVWQDDGVME